MRGVRNVLGMCLSAAILCGCGGPGKDVPKLGTVTGVVTLDGEPLENAMVQFVPDHARMSGGKTDAQGKYELNFNERLKGAAIGKHKVRITVGSPMEPQKIPAKYNVQTELTAEVKEGPNTINFDLTSK
jgi:hypothetical protein